MNSPRLFRLVTTFIVLTSSCLAQEAETKPRKDDAPDYVQFVEDEAGARLRTGVGAFENARGVRVDLIGAVHIADKAYYDKLNALFKGYDAVLYELVGRSFEEQQKTDPAELKEERSRLGMIGAVQEMMRNTLGLVGQMEGIDYKAKNLVHADMDTSEFFDTQERKGESFLGLWVRAFKAQLALDDPERAAKQPGLAKVLEILCSKNSATELKRLVGREFDGIERLIAGIEGDDGTVIIGERNRVAIEALDAQIKKGKKRLGVFYGAAHLGGMEQMMLNRGFKKVGVTWLTAWDLPAEEKKSEPQRSEVPAPAKN